MHFVSEVEGKWSVYVVFSFFPSIELITHTISPVDDTAM